jgi:hypothetical protein
MTISKTLLKLIAAVVAFAPIYASAGVLGTTVTGGMYFNGGSDNYFNSSLGYVPGGCQNSGAGTASVVVVNPAVEFCIADASNTNTAQFTNDTLSVTDLVRAGGASPWKMTFAFAPNTVLGVSETSDFFNNGGLSYSFANDMLILNWAGTGSINLNLNAQYALQIAPTNAVPEPTSVALLSLGVLAFGAARFKRKA